MEKDLDNSVESDKLKQEKQAETLFLKSIALPEAKISETGHLQFLIYQILNQKPSILIQS